jgi:hypothetical protein
MNLSQVIEEKTAIENDALLLMQVLNPYLPNTRYLKSATIKAEGDPGSKGKIVASCQFEIMQSCYIRSTGHFNSVEFNICYNQMMYYVIAKSVKHQLMQAFGDWQLTDYFNKQLPDILIVSFQSNFKRPICGSQFTGEIDFINIKKLKQNNPIIYAETECRFYDTDQGFCEGKVVLVIKNGKN